MSRGRVSSPSETARVHRNRWAHHALAFILGVLVACAPAPAPAPSVPSADRRADAAALERLTSVIRSERSFCSGVWLSPRLMVTARHCFTGLNVGEPTRYTSSGELHDDAIPYRVGVLAALDNEHDLALVLASDPPEHEVAELHTGSVDVGEFTQTMGHPLTLWYSYSTGVVASVREYGGTTYVQSTAPISPGSSGGGLFDSSGRLIGIADVVVSDDGAENLNLFVHVDYVRALLASQGER